MKNSETWPRLGEIEYWGGLGIAILGLVTLNPAEVIVGGVLAWDGNRRRQ